MERMVDLGSRDFTWVDENIRKENALPLSLVRFEMDGMLKPW
jgi:hypothetical protein